MQRKGSQLRQVGGNDEAAAASQLVVVAIDSDKSSQHALKWAADHILSKNEIFILLHVRRKITTIPTPSGLQIPITDVDDDVSSAYIEQIDLQTKELLLPFQCFCSRRGLQCKEVILNESDITKAIVDFVIYQAVDKLVVGSSNRNAFTRTFKNLDVPTAVSKTAPEFCSVYVISKGKISSVRPATRPKKLFANKLQELDATGCPFQSVKSTPEVRRHFGPSGRTGAVHGTRNAIYERVYDNRTGEMTAIGSQIGGHIDASYYSSTSCPSPCRASFDQTENVFSREIVDADGKQLNISPFLIEYNGGEQGKGFVLNSYDYGNCPNSIAYGHDNFSNSIGYGNDIQLPNNDNNWQSNARSNGIGHMPPIPKREVGSWSHHSIDDLESMMSSLKLELKHKMNSYDDSTPKVRPRNTSFETLKSIGLDEVVVVAPKTALIKQRSILPLPESPKATKLENEVNSLKSENHTWLQEIAEKRRELETISSDIRYRRYSVDEILKATDSFSDSLKIGEGGYGPVFKSTIDHTVVAIKILRSDVAQGIKQFQKEVEVLSCIRHPNMVLLLGACPEYGCLVYEYMSNGNLEDQLFCSSGTPPLSWQLRFKIAAEIATGLLFLHQTKPEPLVHRDLKPANILLDNNFVSKIADVGLARLIPSSIAGTTQYHMTAAAGTFCYIDPEYQKTGLVSTKSDIYALGVILLQLVTARPPMGLAHYVENSVEMGSFEQMLDPNIPNWPKEQAMRLTKIALNCAELRRKDRPDLATVVLPQLNELRAFAESTIDPAWQASRWNSRSSREMRNSLSGIEEFAKVERTRGHFSH
ncbi:hypothetical protein M5K25_012352 [Dendrobium thyrsiflorum]|uniref:RING-type E3 ubiquitin transferase n=1 Tax=Dendrobium thyrsiflorum TaxID=117978 RepID=A0ABD0UX48_DENTH